jgi:two-component system, chemotaxis family, CheB/CheR fusion protein
MDDKRLKAQQKQQTVELREQAEILNHSNMFVLDPQARIIMWNAGCEALYGYTSTEAIGKNADELLHTQFPVSRADAERRLREIGVWQGELIHTVRSGARIVVASHWTLYQREPNKPPVILEVNNDITARRSAEDALREADRNKDRFLLTLGHELRNPLGAIVSSVTLLRMPNVSGEVSTKALDIIERQLKNLVRLVDDLLDVERLTRGRIILKKEPTEISAVINAASEISQALCDPQGHKLIVEVPKERIILDGDLARLGQAVSNLVHNACKYSPPGSRVELKAECEGNEARIRVRDYGMGIPPEMIPKLFDMYAQRKTFAGADAQGFGIGLALVRQLVELHGGSVSGHSEGMGKGSEFVIRLPVASEQSIPPKSTPSPLDSAKLPKRKILIIEDDRDASEAMAALLETDGHEPRIAIDGAAALALAEQFKPDAAIIDIGLPDLDGYEVAARIREIYPKIVLVAVSGWPNNPRDDRDKKAKFNHYFVKPLEYEQLTRILSEI